MDYKVGSRKTSKRAVLNCRASDEELATLKARATAAGLSVSGYVRVSLGLEVSR